MFPPSASAARTVTPAAPGAARFAVTSVRAAILSGLVLALVGPRVLPYADVTHPAGSGAALASARSDSAAPGPNILIIVTDDQREGLMSAMPRTKKYFVQQGRKYPNAYATTPMCCPSRASILTGRYAHNHGVLSNAPDSFASLGTMLQTVLDRHGHRTALFGKFLNSWPKRKAPPGFAEYAVGTGYRNTTWNVNGTMRFISKYNTVFIGDRAVRFLRSTGTDPWMLVIAPYAPHAPFEAQTSYRSISVPPYGPNKSMLERDRTDKPPWVRAQNHSYVGGLAEERAEQYRTLPSVDDLVARLFTEIHRLGQGDTLAFFLSDNGYLWGEHGLKRKGHPYTHSVRVPFYARWPGNIPSGTVDRRLAANIDIASTVLAALGLPHMDLDGRDLLNGRKRSRVLLEYWCNLSSFQCNRWASNRTTAYQYIENYDSENRVTWREYYDLRHDPWQLRNLLRDGNPHNDPPVATLHRRLRADRRCTAAQCP